MRRAAALIALVLPAVLPAPPHAAPLACTGDPTQPHRYDMTVAGQPAYGRFAAPRNAPTALVVLAHGYSFNSQGYERHVTATATGTGALAVAPNYRGTKDLPP